jgi:hypothetical protein
LTDGIAADRARANWEDAMAVDIEEIEKALVDVRKAYRLIYLYQRRVLDICRTISKELGLRSHSVRYWFERPAHDHIGKDKWVWDMIPMYRINFLFIPVSSDYNSPKSGDWMLNIRILSDSGYPEEAKSEPDPTRFTCRPEDSKTYIGLYAMLITPGDRNWRDLVNPNMKYPKKDDVVEVEGAKVCGSVFDLADLYDRESIKGSVNKFKEDVGRKLGITFDV